MSCELPDGSALLISLGLHERRGCLSDAGETASGILKAVGLPPVPARPVACEHLVMIRPRRICSRPMNASARRSRASSTTRRDRDDRRPIHRRRRFPRVYTLGCTISPLRDWDGLCESQTVGANSQDSHPGLDDVAPGAPTVLRMHVFLTVRCPRQRSGQPRHRRLRLARFADRVIDTR